jgi:hypothetical protein
MIGDAMNETVRSLHDRVNAALLESGWETLNDLVGPDARMIGPKGFMIDRVTWMGVHREANTSRSGSERARPMCTSTTTPAPGSTSWIPFVYKGESHAGPVPGHPGLGHPPRPVATRRGAVHAAAVTDVRHVTDGSTHA